MVDIAQNPVLTKINPSPYSIPEQTPDSEH
jgi:hypothetical protein